MGRVWGNGVQSLSAPELENNGYRTKRYRALMPTGRRRAHWPGFTPRPPPPPPPPLPARPRRSLSAALRASSFRVIRCPARARYDPLLVSALPCSTRLLHSQCRLRPAACASRLAALAAAAQRTEGAGTWWWVVTAMTAAGMARVEAAGHAEGQRLYYADKPTKLRKCAGLPFGNFEAKRWHCICT